MYDGQEFEVYNDSEYCKWGKDAGAGSQSLLLLIL